jgi:hypothetical protein
LIECLPVAEQGEGAGRVDDDLVGPVTLDRELQPALGAFLAEQADQVGGFGPQVLVG